jgi:diaminopimelate epimerase
MLRFTKAHAYGNDFLYVRGDAVRGARLDVLTRELCDRHTGVGADGLIVFDPTADGASMRLFNADGGMAEVSGNGLRGLGAILLRGRDDDEVVIQTEAGAKQVTRVDRGDNRRPRFTTAMGLPRDLRQADIRLADETVRAAIMDFGNPQAVVLGLLPDEARLQQLGRQLERHALFPAGTNVEFAHVQNPDVIQILIWERGVGPTSSSGTGSCAALIAAAAFGGAQRAADVAAPGGIQRVEWRDDSVYLTGWAEILFDGEWLRPADGQGPQIPRTG